MHPKIGDNKDLFGKFRSYSRLGSVGTDCQDLSVSLSLCNVASITINIVLFGFFILGLP